MSSGWSVYVILLTAITIIGCAWLLYVNRKAKIEGGDQGKPLGHDFDGIQELNNPLPAWWSWLFVITIILAIGYLVLYPGLGSFGGTLGWTSTGQHDDEVARASAKYDPIFSGYFSQQIPALLSDERALRMGARLFANNCSMCHGADARGGKGYPNLTDNDWLYGGEPETIAQTITHGRIGAMPALGTVIGGEVGVREMAQYVLGLSAREHDEAAASRAAPKFLAICSVCHGPEGKGNPAMGAPNLTDDTWLHGGRVIDIEFQITNGRTNQMPAHKSILSPEKIHLLALHVYSLSNRE